MKEENTKKLINEKIKREDLQKISKIVTKKALKVISCNGSMYAINLLENKDLNTLEDLFQEVATQIILDDYTITKNAFKTVRKYIYNNYEKNEIEIFSSDEEEETKRIDNIAYISFLNNNNEEMQKNKKIDLDNLNLTDRQKEIIEMYAGGTSCRDIAKLLNISSVGTVSNTIKRIKNKILIGE